MIIALAGELPKAPAPGPDVAAYFSHHHSALLTIAYLEGLAGVLMIWFWGVLRSVVAKAEGGTGRLSAVVLVAGTGQALLYTLSGAFLGTLAYHAPRTIDSTSAALLYRMGSVAFQAGAFPLGAALLAAAIVGLRSRALPSWLSWISGAFGVIALALRAIPEETYGPERVGSVAFFLVPLWFAVTGVVMTRRSTGGKIAITV
ncbi:MAG: hypothetical protein E6G44_08340 [Actinobacteria bacterium]|nr:MAG: hypothetical protein E6G44_08340 [Actinomycetota bacterium]